MHRLSLVGVSGQAGSGKDTIANYLCEEYQFKKVALADPIKRFGYHVFHFSEKQLWGPSSARNALDKRYNEEYTWDEAQSRLEAWGHQYVCDILGDDDPSKTQPAHAALIHWFFWLKRSYFGKLSPRIMLQTLGTEWGREAVSESIWMDYMLRTARSLLHEDGTTKFLDYDPLNGCMETEKDKTPRGIVVSDIRFENEFRRIREVGGAVIRVIRPDTDAGAATIGVEGHASEAHDYSFDDFDFILYNEGSLVDLYQNIDTYMTIYDSTHH